LNLHLLHFKMNTYCGFSSLTEQCLPKDSMYSNTSNNCLKEHLGIEIGQ
jgi:hypothetical protein